jgi:hypothetical protein
MKSRALLLGFLLACPLPAATLTVTNTNDNGPGSLRQAIADANVAPGSTIAFAIGSGLQMIRPLSPLPALLKGTVDGTTQPGYAGTPLIAIDGSLLPPLSQGLAAFDSTLTALRVISCPYFGIQLSGNSKLTRSFVGTDPTGTSARPNVVGVEVDGSFQGTTVIGGLLPGEGNVISGNTAYGIFVQGGSVVITGNRVGTDVAGLAAVPNQTGIELDHSTPYGGAPPFTIGGTSPGAGNLISGNNEYGIVVFSSTDVLIQGNVIGPDASGGVGLGSQRAGVTTNQSARVTVGGSAAAANVIAFHSLAGVGIEGGSSRITISRNSIFANAFGIDLDFVRDNPDRITPNDPGDPDTGPNLLQNFPILTSASSVAGGIALAGTLNSVPNSTFTIELFASTACNASGNGEGQTFLGAAVVTTNSSGDGSFAATFPTTLLPGAVIAATATDALGDTSEFSPCLLANVPPVPLAFHPLPPCRILDTRNPDGPLGGPALAANALRSFDLAGSCGLPASAAVVSTNVVVVTPAAPGSLRIFASDAANPPTGMVSVTSGRTRSNNGLTSVSRGGTASVTVQNLSAAPIHFAVDVNGYFQ